MYSFKTRSTFSQILLSSFFLLFLMVLLLNRRTRYVNETCNQKLTSEELLSFLNCKHAPLEFGVDYRGEYMVLTNFIRAQRNFECHESVTLTAPGDYRFLDNVIELVERWDGPISVALYAPGDDFFTTLRSIAYLRNCRSERIRELVTFHLFFENEHMPFYENTPLMRAYVDSYDCSQPPPYENVRDENMYKFVKNLTYPINVARNVAKQSAQTHFVFPLDVELYPTRSFVRKFMEFVMKNSYLVQQNTSNVFVLPIFEILEGQTIPETKSELRQMLEEKTAIIFHQSICLACHRIPKNKEWVISEETDGLDIFTVGTRTGPQKYWEPFFVCTQKEPLWDERLNWEGQGNKMCQAYHLCMLNYNFLVMNNAFLIHKPGVKKKKVQMEKHKDQLRKNNRILNKITSEMTNIYGINNKCKIHGDPSPSLLPKG